MWLTTVLIGVWFALIVLGVLVSALAWLGIIGIVALLGTCLFGTVSSRV
jgi:hypothetical protein